MLPTTQHPKSVCFYCGPLPVCCPAHKQNVIQNGSSDLLTSLKCFDFSLPEDLKKTFWYSLKDLLPTFLSVHSMARHRGFLLVMGHTFPSLLKVIAQAFTSAHNILTIATITSLTALHCPACPPSLETVTVVAYRII